MRFGLFGSAAARRGSGEFDSAEGFRDFIEYNVEAEALGFHGTFVVEHHFTGFGQVSATLNLLTWLGARTRTLRLGTAVIVLPWHNPVLLAEQAATLDLLSGGRLDFGIGKGYRYNEFAGFDVPMEEADARFEELLDVLLKAWTSSRALLASRQVLAVQRHRRRTAVGAKTAPADLDGRRQRALDPQRRRARLQPSARTICVAGRCGTEHRLVQVRRRGQRPPLRSDAGRRHARLLRYRQRSRNATRRWTAGCRTACGS